MTSAEAQRHIATIAEMVVEYLGDNEIPTSYWVAITHMAAAIIEIGTSVGEAEFQEERLHQ